MDFDKVKKTVDVFFNGQYEVKRFLGSGSFADVYLVKHNFLDDLRAMKIVKEPLKSTSNVQNVFHEVRIATQLRQENIISIYDAGIISKNHDSLAYFVMEYVKGGDLEQYLNSFIKSNLFMSISQVLKLIKQILKGLNTLHSAEPVIVHRDLKLNNILLSYDVNGDIIIKISDFGIAKEITENISDIDVAGTRLYMAPESFNKSISAMTDIYAVGVIFYQLLTNHYPYNVDEFELEELLDLKPWKQEVKPPSHYNEDVFAELDEIVIKCLDVNPYNRFKDANELLVELEILIDKMDDDPIIEYVQEDIQTGYEYIINDSLEKAFNLSKMENKLNQAIEILEREVLSDYHIRQVYGETLQMWKSDNPDVKLISKAFTVNLGGCNYYLSCDLLREAIAYNPRIKSTYGYYLELWAIFIEFKKEGNLIKSVLGLEKLMKSYEEIKNLYSNVINTLKTFSIEEIVNESIRLANINNLSDAALLMEFAVVYNSKIKEKYSYQLSLWKQNIKLKFDKNNKTKENTIDYAIDLGTTDSVISYFNGGEPIIIKNHLTGDDLTPSAVLIDDENNVHVGVAARNMLVEDSKNAISEFKHNMGFEIPFQFESASRVLYPEELSSEVLKDLRVSVYSQCGVNMEHAVICVPANSNPMKTKAINDAARLAGFKSQSLIFEPIAVALAYDLKKSHDGNGIWMIYDLGGGTFNVTLIKDNHGEIEKIDSLGLDNSGGNLLDWLVVEKRFSPIIESDLNLNDFKKDNPKYIKAFSKLKRASETAKIELSKSEIANVSINNLFEGYDFKFSLNSDEFKRVILPHIKDTFDLCNLLLEKNNIIVRELDSVILVGGSCLSPIVKECVHDEFKVTVEDSIDPLTVVSRGASIYAGNLEIPPTKNQHSDFSIIIDKENLINGRIFSLDSTFLFLGFSIEFKNNDYSSGKVPIDIDGTFKTQIEYDETYDIKVYHENTPVDVNNIFLNYPNDIEIDSLINRHHSLLKIVDNLKEYDYFTNYDLLDYLKRLIEISKSDEIAISPADEYLNKLEKMVFNIENEFKVKRLLENIESKVRIIKKNDLFEIDESYINEIIQKKDVDELNEVYTQLIEKYVTLHKNDVIESLFFNLKYEGVYSENQDLANELIDKALESINNSNYKELFNYVNELYELDERNNDYYG